MSTQTVKICDVMDCDLLATTTLEVVAVANFNINQERQDTSDGLHIWNEYNVDLCGSHVHEYRGGLPSMRLDQMSKAIQNGRDKKKKVGVCNGMD